MKLNELANVERLITTYYKSIGYCGIGLQGVRNVKKMDKNKCGECFWFTIMDNEYKTYDHYCKLHYMQEMRHKNERACGDFIRCDSDGRVPQNNK